MPVTLSTSLSDGFSLRARWVRPANSSRRLVRLTRPTLLTYTATTEELRASTADLFKRISAGDINIEVNQRYALADIQQAHRDLESRKTTGSTLVLP